MFHWLIMIIVGGVIGWLASIVMKTNAQMGIILNVLIGIVGSWLGVWIFSLLGLGVGGTIVWLIACIAGACLLILILKALKVLK